MSAPTPRRPSRAHLLLPIAVATLGGLLAAQTIGRDPRYVGPLLAFALLLFAPALVGRWRMRKLLMSGDVERVIGTWEDSIGRVPHRDTMAPLLQATAYAAYGWIEAARRALERALRGPAWEAALEQRLFVETLLDAFEGDREEAVRKASALEGLPMPRAGPAHRAPTARPGGPCAGVRPLEPQRRHAFARQSGQCLSTRPLGYALRSGHCRRGLGARGRCRLAALGCPCLAGPERVPGVPR